MENEDNNEVMQVTNNKLLILAQIRGASIEKYYEKDDKYKTHNVIIVTENNQQKDKILTEVIARDICDEFQKLNPNFIQYKKYSKD